VALLEALEHASKHPVTRIQIKLGDPEKIVVSFRDGSELILWDDNQACCETRSVTSDDPLGEEDDFLQDVSLEAGPVCVDIAETEEYSHHETAFLRLHLRKRVLTFETHADHNGYYGGFDILASFTLNPKTGGGFLLSTQQGTQPMTMTLEEAITYSLQALELNPKRYKEAQTRGLQTAAKNSLACRICGLPAIKVYPGCAALSCDTHSLNHEACGESGVAALLVAKALTEHLPRITVSLTWSAPTDPGTPWIGCYRDYICRITASYVRNTVESGALCHYLTVKTPSRFIDAVSLSTLAAAKEEAQKVVAADIAKSKCQ
jgi:hypothetical protein